jgi:hypothetical protein
MAGADNRAAVIALALISLAAAAILWRRAPRSSLTQHESLSKRWLLAAILATTAFTASLGYLVLRANAFWGDEGYFVTQLRTGILFHRTLYRDFEFPYGPLIYWWPATFARALSPLSITAAYLIALAVMQAVGLALLFYVIQALPIRRPLKAAAFALITFGALSPVLGINYTLLRFALPLAAAVLLSRQRRLLPALTIAALAEILALAISPELGISVLGMTLACALHHAITRNLRWLTLAPAALLGATLFALLLGRDYFLMVSRIAKGEYNLLIQPSPHLFLFLASVVALAPLAVARTRHADPTVRATIFALYAASLGVIPAALGRCDQVHDFFNGIGPYLLAFVAIDTQKTRTRLTWVLLLTLIFSADQLSNYQLYSYRLHLAIHSPQELEDHTIDAPSLEQAIGSATITAPAGAPLWLQEELTRTNQYRPGYFREEQGLWDSAAELRMIQTLRASPFALIPAEGLEEPTEVDLTGWRKKLGLDRLYKPRHAPYIRGGLTQQELHDHWTQVGIFGSYRLFHRQS